ncbi:DUF2332 family protein [Fodinicurvata halophila]|uniref:DUF2332 family protein n=1 Tax=Fodinicurvata halophila TaxID=1419723 RepID=UPI0036250E18
MAVFPTGQAGSGTRRHRGGRPGKHRRRPLAWLAMEDDGQPGGAAVTLRLWPGDHHIALGRAGFHGQWVEWHADSR